MDVKYRGVAKGTSGRTGDQGAARYAKHFSEPSQGKFSLH